jgi:serine/threonine protein kinase
MLRSSGNVGKYIEGYHISLELASSSSSRVFLGESVSPERQNVAIKHFYGIHIASKPEQDAFLQEASEFKQFDHPHILLLLSADSIKGTPYIVSEYAPNRSLHDRLQRQAPQPMAQDEAITIISQIGQALQYAHQKNKVHGNLKPQNILFNSNGDPLLADFKFTSLSPLLSTFAATSPSALTYMPAEQLEGIISKENDQYSLGCIAYEIFTGRKPFTTPSLKQPGTVYKTRTLIPPCKLNPALPAHIDKAIVKAMAKDPSQRYTSVLEFIKALGNPGILTVPEDLLVPYTQPQNTPPIPSAFSKNAPTLTQQSDSKGKPLLRGLKVATAESTTLGQFNARTALWRTTFTSMTNLSALPLPKWAISPSPSQRKRHTRRLFLIVASILLITAIAAGTIFAFSPFHALIGKQQAANRTGNTSAIIQTQTQIPPQQAAPTPPPTKGTGRITIPAQPTQSVQKHPTPRPTPRPTPVVHTTPQPTITPTQPPPPPSNRLAVAPASLNASNCTSNGNGSYNCSVVLSLGSAAGSNQNWYTYSINVTTSFKPSNGSITPGQNITITITVFDNCTKPSTFVFVGSKTNVTSTWNC